MNEIIEAWQCIGCGRIEYPQPCLGVCQDRKINLVDAQVLDQLSQRLDQCREVLALIANTTPKAQSCAKHWTALQARAREVLGQL